MKPYGPFAPTLQELVDACRSGEQQFRDCALHAQRVELRQLFAWRAEEFAQVVVRLSHASALGDSPVPDRPGDNPGASAVNAGHRASGPTDDHALLAACEQGERDVLVRLEDALSDDLSPELHAVLTEAHERVQRHQAQIRSLRSHLSATSGGNRYPPAAAGG